eukprot:snap_masked-scaffold_55-processed-gene-1.24-mRNA-1 protein AED:1.00 eAED:1.00 QI:0/0/0/0/1/1/2/0/575
MISQKQRRSSVVFVLDDIEMNSKEDSSIIYTETELPRKLKYAFPQTLLANRKPVALLLLSLWFLISFFIGLFTLGQPDSTFVQFFERLPLLFGIPISIFHACADNKVQSSRALCKSLVSFLLCLVLSILLYKKCFSKKKYEQTKRDSILSISSKTEKIENQNKNSFYKYFLFNIFIVSLLQLLLFSIKTVLSHDALSQQNLLRTSSSFTERKEWMKDFQHKHMLELLLPGSHDSGAIEGDFQGNPFFYHFVEPFSATNDKNITQQLEMGIRSIDIRLCDAEDKQAKLCHGPVLHYLGFKNALQQVVNFVSDHPTEVVIVQMKPDFYQRTRASKEKKYYSSVLEEVSELKEKLVYLHEKLDTIGNLTSRGKNIILVCSDQDCNKIFSDYIDDIHLLETDLVQHLNYHKNTSSSVWHNKHFHNTWKEDEYNNFNSFSEVLYDYLCNYKPTPLNPYNYSTPFDARNGPVRTREEDFIYYSYDSRFVLLNGQVAVSAVDVFFEFFPSFQFLFLNDEIVGSGGLRKLAEKTNQIVLDKIHLLTERDGTNCYSTTRVNILTHDFLTDEIVQEIILYNMHNK